MAHRCPKCHNICFCNGDIDDLLFECEGYCNHCEEDDEDDEDDWLDDYLEENSDDR